MECIKSDRNRCVDTDADLYPTTKWENQQFKFARTKTKVLGIIQQARNVTDVQMNRGHSLRMSATQLKDMDKYSAASIRNDYRKLNRYIHRFMIRIQQRGAFMKMTKFPHQSKHQKLLEEAREYLRQAQELHDRQ